MSDNSIVRRRTISASQIRDGVLLDFDDGEPGMVSEVTHLARKVVFMARGTQFSLDADEMVQLVVLMRVVG